MPRKKTVDKLGPYLPDQTLGVIAGCPFTSFRNCASEKCVFFVAIPPNLTERACMFRSLYYMQICHALESLPSGRAGDRSMFEDELSAPRVVESILGYLDRLDGIAAHPKSEAVLISRIQAVRSTLYRRLKTFAETGSGKP